MYKISLEVLGERLKHIRGHLGFSQIELAQKLNTTQSALSKIENGLGGSLLLLTTMLNFYSQHIYLNSLFSETFHLVSIDNKEGSKSNLESIISEIIHVALVKHQEATESAQAELEAKLKRATDLLK